MKKINSKKIIIINFQSAGKFQIYIPCITISTVQSKWLQFNFCCFQIRVIIKLNASRKSLILKKTKNTCTLWHKQFSFDVIINIIFFFFIFVFLIIIIFALYFPFINVIRLQFILCCRIFFQRKINEKQIHRHLFQILT